MYEEVITQLYLIERVLVGGGRKRQGSTDWLQLRRLATALKSQAIQLRVREAVNLFDRLCQMADDALLGLPYVEGVSSQAADRVFLVASR